MNGHSYAAAGPSRGRAIHTTNHPLSAPPTTGSFAFDHDEEEQTLDVIPTRAGRKLCVRHKQMANQNVNAKLQKVSRMCINQQCCTSLCKIVTRQFAHLRKARHHTFMGDIFECSSYQEEVDPGGSLDHVLFVR
jgi:hypothetical protein